jgi:hypothetical protein
MVFSIDVRRSPSETALESDQLDQSRPLTDDDIRLWMFWLGLDFILHR